MTHSLLVRAEVGGTPIIAGDTATFVWQGAAPPVLVSDLSGWDRDHPAAWTEVAPALWSHTMTLTPDAYIEYAYLTGAARDERTPDPFNSRATANGVGQINHFFYMPAGAATPLAQRVRGVPSGAVTRHVVEHKALVVGGKRPVWLYQPPTPDPAPLVVVFDGGDYYRRGRLTQIVDNLIYQGRIRPLALALVENGGAARVIEYACSDATLGFLMEGVLPLAADRLRLTAMHTASGLPGAYGVLGASMGGLMALYTGMRLPHVFGHVLSQSGAFWRGPLPWVVETLVRDGAVRPLKIWLDVGRYEWLLPGNRDLHALLVERGYEPAYREFSGGHNYPAWRDDLWRGLEHLYPGEASS